MKIIRIERTNILDYEKEIRGELVVTERDRIWDTTRYYATIPDIDIISGGVLVGVFGNGNTIEEAVTAYCNEISNKQIAIKAGTSDRINTVAPLLYYKSQRKKTGL